MKNRQLIIQLNNMDQPTGDVQISIYVYNLEENVMQNNIC